MLKIAVPGRAVLELTDLVLDYNGTLAEDGYLLAGVVSRLQELALSLNIVVITADTFGRVRTACQGLPLTVEIIAGPEGFRAKERLVERIGPTRVAAIGNGYNDFRMLETAALGIAVIGPEGCAGKSLLAADVVVSGIGEALDLLRFPQRLVATLRE